jgi:hypothetical protein
MRSNQWRNQNFSKVGAQAQKGGAYTHKHRRLMNSIVGAQAPIKHPWLRPWVQYTRKVPKAQTWTRLKVPFFYFTSPVA